ncbi:MAG: STM3941 family protein [Eubacteriaceae bacterium]
MNEIIIKENKNKVIQLIILAIILVLVSMYNLVIGIIEINLLYLVIGIMGITFFGACFFLISRRMSNNRPLLIIGKDGITDMSNANSVGFVAWKEIESVSVRRVFVQKFIGITVYDFDKLMNGISPMKQNTIKANMKLKYPPICIPLNTADTEFSEVLSIVQNRFKNR